MPPQLRRIAQHAVLRSLVRQDLFGTFLDDYLGDNWRYDMNLTDRRIVFSSPTAKFTAGAHLLASVAAKPASLMWGWSPSFASLVGPNPVGGWFREFGQQHQVAELLTEEVPYVTPPGRDQSEYMVELCHDVGAAATVVFGPESLYYSVPTGEGVSRVVVLLDSFSAPVPEPSTTEIFTRLPLLLSAVDDLAWSLDGLARFSPGLRMEHGSVVDQTHEHRLIDETGTSARVLITYGPGGRVEKVNMDMKYQP